MNKPRRRGPDARQILLAVLKVLYIFLFVAAAMVVILFCVFKATIKPPEQNDTPASVVTDLPVASPQVTPGGQDTQPEEPEPITLEKREDFYTFLLMGTDDGNGNADTIMVGSYDTKYNKISVLSVPRDTLVDVNRTVKKINGAYGSGGIAQVLDELEPILGFRPDHYIKVDLQAFVDIVDILGGISYYVPEDMYHNDGAGFIIDLKEGTQWLNGEQAMQLVRYRGYKDGSADMGRMKTQQKFLAQLAKQVLSWSTVPKINEFAQVFKTHLDTDLSVTELAYFATQALTLNFSADVTFATLPGNGEVSYLGIPYYYQLYPEACLDLINDTVNPYTTDIPAEMVDIFQAS